MAALLFGGVGALWMTAHGWALGKLPKQQASAESSAAAKAGETSSSVTAPTGGIAESTAAPNAPKTASKRNVSDNTSEPIFTFPGFRESVDMVNLSIGGNIASIPVSKLKDKNYKGEAFNIGGEIITPYIDGNKIYVDINVYGGFALPSVQIKHGSTTVDVPGWDRNSDQSAFEVVNEAGIPVFQMIYLTPSDITIRGLLQFPDGTVLAANEVDTVINPPNPYNHGPKKIFKYPSRLHPGEEAELK